jgi:hypothetical protein
VRISALDAQVLTVELAKKTRRPGSSKGPRNSTERLNIHRFVRCPRKNAKRFGVDQSAWYWRNLLASESIVSISERFFYPYAHTHRYGGGSLFNNLFFDHPPPETAMSIARMQRPPRAPHPSYSSIENGISMSDGVSNGKCKKEKKYIMLIIERVVRSPSLN